MLLSYGCGRIASRFEAEIHEDRDDRGKAKACEKAGVMCQVQRQTSVIPVIETAELFDQKTERYFSKRKHTALERVYWHGM